MATDSIVTELCGVVSCTNGNGFRIAGREAWVNISKFTSVAMPEVGQRVRIGLDKAGYARAVSVDVAQSAPQAQQDACQWRVLAEVAADYPTATVDRDMRIMRQAVLNTATAILSSAGRAVETDAVLFHAETLEQWVCR